VLTTEEAIAWEYSEHEKEIALRERSRVVIGTPDSVREQLISLAQSYEVDELMAITITGEYRTRLKSYELLADAFSLNG
jgi:alkanesulfonate monooxygenase SsuD/methylene tetrahydromethanopterin reductase-like flavin-dependent oxidoreductase (luciferase family)